MQDRQYNGVVLEDKWGKTYLCSSCLLAWADLGSNTVRELADSEYGRYFLHDLEPGYNLRDIWAQLYQHARPWATDLTKLNNFQLRDTLLQMFARDEMRVWQLSDGWGKQPEGNGIGEGGLAPASSGNTSSKPAAKVAKPKGGGVTTEAPVAAKAAGHEGAVAPAAIDGLEQKAAELAAIGKEIRANGYTPKTDAEIQQAIASGDIGDQRYLVSVQKRKSKDEPVGYRRPDTGRTTMWVSTFDMMKDKDLSAPLLMAALGSDYDPASEYDLYILDQGAGHETDGALTFVPTFENMQKYGPEELHKDNPSDIARDKELLKSVMTPEQQKEYAQNIALFRSQAVENEWNEFTDDDINDFLNENSFSKEEKAAFRSRHLYRTQIGNNAYFTGNGATEFSLNKANAEAIARDGIKLNKQPGKLGTPEILTIQKNPQSIAALESQGRLKIIPIKKGG